jgi:hypothetical protein
MLGGETIGKVSSTGQYHSWASASIKLTPASAFRHLSSQSGTALKKCRNASFYSGNGSVPALLVFFSPVPDRLDAGQSGIPAVSIAVVSIAVVSIAVVIIVVVSIAVPVVSIAVVSIAVVSIAVVSIAVVSIALVSIAVVISEVVSIAEPQHAMRLQSAACHAAPVRHSG